MKQSIHSGLRSLLALPLTFVTVAAFAQSGSSADLNRVEVSGQKLPTITRYDVRASCPGVDKQLQESLATTWARQEKPGIVNVQFTLKGSDITEVRASGGPSEYRTPVKRAVRVLNCGAEGSQEQSYKFQVAFLAPDAERAGYSASLVELKD